MERLMLSDPSFWQGHYRGASDDLRVQRHFGLADRIRYYWPLPEARSAVAAVLSDLNGKALPDPLLAQVFAPEVIERAAWLGGDKAQSLITAQIQQALAPYFFLSRSGKELRQ
jgi:D-tagatose-1,6-bisphosphate aldolase subunit GatZ/KbaZ